MKKLTIEERKQRIIARGEHSGHSHIITGNAVVRNSNDQILIDIKGEAAIEHLLEDAWMKGECIHTKEHEAISLTDMPDLIRQGDIALKKVAPKTYQYIQQKVYDPLSKRIEDARD